MRCPSDRDPYGRRALNRLNVYGLGLIFCLEKHVAVSATATATAAIGTFTQNGDLQSRR